MADELPTDRPPPGTPGLVGLIERSVVLLLVLGLLVGVGAVLWPFTTAILFGATLAVAAWPLRHALVSRGLRPGLVATLLLLLAIILVVLPVLAMAPVVSDQLVRGSQVIREYFATAPPPPAWLTGLPLLGDRLARIWNELARAGGNLATALAPYSATLQQALLGAARALTASVVQIALSLVVATMFWINGATLAQDLREILLRLGGPTAAEALQAAAGAVRSVAYGVIGTAAAQAALLALGLALAGVPGATSLGFIGLLLALSQIGGPLLALIWGGAAWWLFGQGEHGWGIFMIAWGLLVSTVDNFLKPWLIGLGVHMPMSLTILGVFGGFIAFGFLGLFIGPTLIAVAFILLQAWRAETPR
ncbi:AI-2E family transporter [Rhodovastum atsumiense]|uniref:AI-2E family transporter n=1 Tax=Rhodovastum atsumiense TaxID=504468 RepID=A0A5M6IQ43_9PROT|nr:AI-2E family transporter [Rhodovastum atsumiense]KAA5610392.1 AI-2E family transporter [Rhodovastum atsumiense]CAH2602929.1 AI-2E family transporter [Rhodovastum atsumiense]